MTNLHKKQLEYLQAMQIDVWCSRSSPSEGSRQLDSIPDQTPAPPPQTDLSTLDWQNLEVRVSQCRSCNLSEKRTRTVFGTGSLEADWLFVGEAPGAEEDRVGEPFVGRAGKLLDGMLFALGLSRSQVYIANTVKCRPPDNRNPKPEEMQTCNPYLEQQIKLLQPKVLVALGGVAAKHLLQTDQKVGQLRGQVFEYGERKIPLLVTYHPAYLLRSPREKAKVWEDLQQASTLYNGLP